MSEQEPNAFFRVYAVLEHVPRSVVMELEKQAVARAVPITDYMTSLLHRAVTAALAGDANERE